MLEKFWSPEPVIAVKQYFIGTSMMPNHYSPMGMGIGQYVVGRWYDALHNGDECRTDCWEPKGMVRPLPCGFYAWKSVDTIQVVADRVHSCEFEPCNSDVHWSKDCLYFASRGMDEQYWNAVNHNGRGFMSINLAWLEVELGGTIVEHEYGYRATRQRIVKELGEEIIEQVREAINKQLDVKIPQVLDRLGLSEERVIEPWPV